MGAKAILFAVLAAAGVYILNLQRQLESARRRGDMYRDISARLDRRIAELSGK